MDSREKTHVTNAEQFRVPATRALVKLRCFSIVVVLGTLLFGFSAPIMGQAVNATLLGTVTDSSGASVANAKVTITETNTGISHASQTNERNIKNGKDDILKGISCVASRMSYLLLFLIILGLGAVNQPYPLGSHATMT